MLKFRHGHRDFLSKTMDMYGVLVHLNSGYTFFVDMTRIVVVDNGS